jgi:hypothetical protein
MGEAKNECHFSSLQILMINPKEIIQELKRSLKHLECANSMNMTYNSTGSVITERTLHCKR